MSREADRHWPRCWRLLLATGLALASVSAWTADLTRTARLVLPAGLLAEAERAQGLYVDALVRASFPDDGDPALVMAVRSAIPPSRLRERWVTLLASQLAEDELRAAEDFYESVPGRAWVDALGRSVAADQTPGLLELAPPELAAIVEALDAPAREAVLRVRTTGAARWAARVVDGDQGATLDSAWADALADEAQAPARSAELEALLRLPSLQAAAVADYAASPLGRRFHGKLTAALDVALAELAREHRGMMLRAARRRAAREPT